jgi:hypothetical protein
MLMHPDGSRTACCAILASTLRRGVFRRAGSSAIATALALFLRLDFAAFDIRSARDQCTQEMVTCLTYYPDSISDYMWSLLPR